MPQEPASAALFGAVLQESVRDAAARHGTDAVRHALMGWFLKHEAEIRRKFPPDSREVRLLDAYRAERAGTSS